MAVPKLPRWKRRMAVFAPPAVLLVFAGVVIVSTVHRQESSDRVQATHRRIAELRQIRTRIVDAETGQRGYLITGDTVYLEPFRQASDDAHALMASLRASYGMEAPQLAALNAMDRQLDRRLEVLELPIEALRTGGPAAARAQLIAGRGIEAMSELRATINAIEAGERERLALEEEAQQRAELVLLVVVLLGGLLVLATAVVTNREFMQYSGALERANAEQEELNERLQEQALELEMQTGELQSTNEALSEQQGYIESIAAELEASNEELQVTNAELEERTGEAEAANRAKAQFLASMSHELRTPLNAIAGYVDILELGVHGALTPAQLKDLERIRHNSRHLLVLISDILNYARVQAGRLELKIADVPLGELTEEAQAVIRPLAQARHIDFTCDDTPPVLVRGDADRIRQILLNLLSNAVKFSDEGGAIVLRAASEDGVVHVAVEDNGPGIPAEYHDAVFDPFIQARRGAGGSLGEGVGLGLSISRELAHAMDGEITLESAPGRGSVFTLTLPRGDGLDRPSGSR